MYKSRFIGVDTLGRRLVTLIAEEGRLELPLGLSRLDILGIEYVQENEGPAVPRVVRKAAKAAHARITCAKRREARFLAENGVVVGRREFEPAGDGGFHGFVDIAVPAGLEAHVDNFYRIELATKVFNEWVRDVLKVMATNAQLGNLVQPVWVFSKPTPAAHALVAELERELDTLLG